MDYTNIKYSKTICPADYSPEVIEVHATLDSSDNLQECAAKLKSEVTAALTGKAVKVVVVAKKKVDEPTETEEETPAPVKKKASKKTTKKAPAKKKNIAYDRDVEAHKTAFGGLALEIEPTWQTVPEMKVKVKQMSVSMAGKPMYSGEGDILESFKTELAEGLAAGEDDL